MTIRAALRRRIDARVDDLVAAFEEIARSRMHDMPLMNRALRVEAVGFEPAQAAPQTVGQALGVLVTPWFMNLVALPIERVDHPLRAGDATLLRLGGNELAFLAAHEPGIGSFKACSVFSPVFEFGDPSVARSTALAVLAALREAQPGAADTPTQASISERPPARRSFLLGRTAAGGGAR
jgi:[NiFe] hydrogenase assembly HybE family chaperone